MVGTRPVTIARVVVALALLGTAGCTSSASETPTDPGPGFLQIGHAQGSSGTIRATAEISVAGSAPLQVLFDTGSSGLRVFDSLVPQEGVERTSETFQTQFGNGVTVAGVTANAPMVVGGVATSGPINFQAIQQTGCVPTSPGCPGADGPEAFARSIGVDGILGVGLSSGEVFSPMLQLSLGIPKTYTIHWADKGGRVTFNDSPADSVATFTMPAGTPPTMPNGAAAWDDQAVDVCWQIADAARTCNATVFDTGSPSVQFPLNFPGGPTKDVRKLANGTRISAATAVDAAPFLEFTAGRRLADDFVTVQPGQNTVDTGLQIFENFAVTYDIEAGTITLSKS